VAGGGSSGPTSRVLVSRHPADHPLLSILFLFSSSFRLRSQRKRSFSAFSFPDKQQEQKRSFFSSHAFSRQSLGWFFNSDSYNTGAQQWGVAVASASSASSVFPFFFYFFYIFFHDKSNQLASFIIYIFI
jgi:hypothetical protein